MYNDSDKTKMTYVYVPLARCSTCSWILLLLPYHVQISSIYCTISTIQDGLKRGFSLYLYECIVLRIVFTSMFVSMNSQSLHPLIHLSNRNKHRTLLARHFTLCILLLLFFIFMFETVKQTGYMFELNRLLMGKLTTYIINGLSTKVQVKTYIFICYLYSLLSVQYKFNPVLIPWNKPI